MTKLSIFIGVIILTFKILCSNVFAGPTFVDEYDVSTDETTPTGVIFNPDGTRMYIVGIDNALVELDAQEVPILDGSAKEWIEILLQSGISTSNAPIKIIIHPRA